jgi:hypothetical protein
MNNIVMPEQKDLMVKLVEHFLLPDEGNAGEPR